MSSVSTAKSSTQENTTPESESSLFELVKKIERSATSLRKRRGSACKRLKKALAEHSRYAKEAGLRAISLTLTYEDSSQFASKHISSVLDTLRKAIKRRGQSLLPYAWSLECAERLHYHLIVWLPRSYQIDKAKLKRWWPWGSTWIENCRNPKAWGRYISKFDSLDRLPKNSRAFGYGGLDENGKTATARACLPRWLDSILPKGHRARRRRGGGWLDTTTSTIYQSPYFWTPSRIMAHSAIVTGAANVDVIENNRSACGEQ